MGTFKALIFINVLWLKKKLDTCILTILGPFFVRNMLIFSFLEKLRVGAYSITDGDCDKVSPLPPGNQTT